MNTKRINAALGSVTSAITFSLVVALILFLFFRVGFTVRGLLDRALPDEMSVLCIDNVEYLVSNKKIGGDGFGYMAVHTHTDGLPYTCFPNTLFVKR